MQIEISEDGILNMIRTINGGALLQELERELINSVGAILDHGGKATINVKFSFTRIKNLEKAIDIGHDVSVTLPKEERAHAAMFVTRGNGLATQHQKQESLPLGEATAQARPTLEPVKTNVSRLGGQEGNQ